MINVIPPIIPFCYRPNLGDTQRSYYSVISLTFMCFIFSCAPPKPPADIILFNGKILTVDREFSIVEAVAISNNEILAIGNDQELLKLASDSTQTIDLHGHTVVPGLIDAHTHPIDASLSELFEKIPDLNTIRELLVWINEESMAKDDGEWIIHPKFFITRLGDMRQVSLAELDSAAPNNPVFLNGSYGGMVNSKAIELSGLTTSDHPGIIRDNTGDPTGIIRSSAFGLLSIDNRENLSRSERIEAIKALFHLYNQVGITSIGSGIGGDEELSIFRELMDSGELTVRVFQNISMPLDPESSLDEMRAVLEKLGYQTGDGNHWVRVGALKTMVDGGMLTGTAFMREGWGNKARGIYGFPDPNYRGELFRAKSELVKLITAADEAGWKFTAHVTGGGGVDTLLAAIEEVNQIRPTYEKRFSIIHGNFFTPAAIKKMADLGIYADMQPAWFHEDADLLYYIFDHDRMKAFHPYNSMIEADIMVNGGSDHMVKLDPNASINPYNPFLSMWSVITRKTESGQVYNPQEAITRKEALQMYTINNAYASFEEDVKGSIEVGKLADLIVLSDDFLSCTDDEIANIKVLLTMIDGRIVYEDSLLDELD